MGNGHSHKAKEHFKNPPIDGHNYEYDLIVVGGGSGGLAAAKEAQKHGRNVAVCDFIKPTPFGTTWGLGGTCTNVGCVPKKLMHTAALTGKWIGESNAYGYTLMPHPSESEAIHEELKSKLEWETLVDNIQTYIRSLNWNNKIILKDKKIEYFNEYAEFVGPHSLQLTNKNNEKRTISGNIILLANGGRPKYVDIPGGKFTDALCITSDDLFSLPKPPGKTLIIGASYVALECAGFLICLGFDVSVMVRSGILRGYDHEISEKIGEHMTQLGVKFLMGYEPLEIKKSGEGKLQVKFKDKKATKEDTFDTVLLAVGRESMTGNMGLDTVGVKVNPKNGRVLVNNNDQTNVIHIFAVGDVADERPEFSPIAVHSGKFLMRRLYEKGFKELTNYDTFPTTIYTPIEYGCCGLSEDKATEKYGADALEVYQSNFSPLEDDLPGVLPKGTCFMKLVTLKKQKGLVVGLHYYGPNAGEVTQGWALGIRLGATKADFDAVIGIHPTCSERFTTLYIVKGQVGEGELHSC